jgi:hypothetical protein
VFPAGRPDANSPSRTRGRSRSRLDVDLDLDLDVDLDARSKVDNRFRPPDHLRSPRDAATSPVVADGHVAWVERLQPCYRATRDRVSARAL